MEAVGGCRREACLSLTTTLSRSSKFSTTSNEGRIYLQLTSVPSEYGPMTNPMVCDNIRSNFAKVYNIAFTKCSGVLTSIVVPTTTFPWD